MKIDRQGLKTELKAFAARPLGWALGRLGWAEEAKEAPFLASEGAFQGAPTVATSDDIRRLERKIDSLIAAVEKANSSSQSRRRC